MAKSDALDDPDVSKVAGRVKDKAKVEEARLNGARVTLAQASVYFFEISVVRFGAARQSASANGLKAKQLNSGEKGN
jgi:hypothetical protein